MDKKQKIMRLWRDTFHDPEEYIRFYFDRKYSDEASLLYEINSRPVSALLMLSYPMTWLGKIINTSYICGACTLPEARNQGFMRALLTEAFHEMNQKGILVCILIPAEEWLYQYYGKLGYTPVFDYSIETYQPTPVPETTTIKVMSPENYHPEFTRNTYPYFKQKMEKRLCCIQHPEEDYLAVVEEIYRSGGRLLTTYTGKQENISGWAVALPEVGHILVKEMFHDSPAEKEKLLQTIRQFWNTDQIQYRIPPHPANARHYGMARIINARQMLQHIAERCPAISLTLRLTDPQLPFNTGSYILANGQCQKIDQESNNPDIIADIPTLTQALLGYSTTSLPPIWNTITSKQQPYMNLMMD